MTTSRAHEIARISGYRRPRDMAGALAARLLAEFPDPRTVGIDWPSDLYRKEPVRFGGEVLGIDPWARQAELLEAVRDYRRVAVRSCNKAGKSEACAIAALWFYCCFPDARVVLTATTARQVDGILWRAIRKLVQRAKFRIDGEPGVLARTGLKAPDFREIIGFTAREAEAVAGVSGANILYIADEASGIDDALFEAIDGNLAGGGRIIMISNPTRTEGRFFEAFRSREKHFKTIHISALETPNVVSGKTLIPGMATREWVEEMAAEYGEDSPFYRVRVLGEFVEREEGKVLSFEALTASQKRWEEAPNDGRLVIGIDPAGEGETGDETAMAVRRGQKILSVTGWRGLTEDGIVAHLLGVFLEHKQKSEIPVVIVDKLGPVGERVFRALVNAAEQHKRAFEVYGVRASDKAMREPQNYDRMRDELWANLVRWVREGGALPPDTKLERELHGPEWETQVSGRLKVTSKEDLRKTLGRSPDRADAVCLAVWEPMALRPRDGSDEAPDVPEGEQVGLDPYAAQDIWR